MAITLEITAHVPLDSVYPSQSETESYDAVLGASVQTLSLQATPVQVHALLLAFLTHYSSKVYVLQAANEIQLVLAALTVHVLRTPLHAA